MHVYKRFLWAWLLLMVIVSDAFAHPASTSAVLIRLNSSGVHLAIHMPIDQLQLAAPELLLDEKQNGISNPERLKIVAYIRQHIQIINSDNQADAFRMVISDVKYEKVDNLPHISLNISYYPITSTVLTQFQLNYDAILHRVVTHKIYVSLVSDFMNGVSPEQPLVLGVIRYQHTHMTIEHQHGSYWQGAKTLFWDGIRHILMGIDHIAFLLCLLIAVPLSKVNGHWVGRATLRHSFINVFKTVTAFTVGHSLTLVLANLGFLQFPSYFVEISVALSIIVVATYLIYPLDILGTAKVSMFFGLIHGLAFANSIKVMKLTGKQLFLALLSFNIGIETVQVLIVIATVPCFMFMAKSFKFYSVFRWFVAVLSIIAASCWFLERISLVKHCIVDC